jgi:hypothetical protein
MSFPWRATVKAVATTIQGSQHLHISNYVPSRELDLYR